MFITPGQKFIFSVAPQKCQDSTASQWPISLALRPRAGLKVGNVTSIVTGEVIRVKPRRRKADSFIEMWNCFSNYGGRATGIANIMDSFLTKYNATKFHGLPNLDCMLPPKSKKIVA